MKKNSNAATYYFKLAADQGNAEGQFWLGICYGNGKGVLIDQIEGLRLMRLAAAQGHKEAQYMLPMLEMGGTRVPVNQTLRELSAIRGGRPSEGVSPAAAAGARQRGLMPGPGPSSVSQAVAAGVTQGASQQEVIPKHL